jgi:SAM-dependent methyltransferase
MYKDKIYESYVSSHTKGLYGEITLKKIQQQFPSWDWYYYKPILSKINKESKVLELGCGNGSFIYYLKYKGFTNLKGIDISAEYLLEGTNLGFQNLYLEDILDSLKSEEKYDLIIARDVFEHFDKDSSFKMFELIFSKLNKGGNLLIQVPNGHGIFVNMIYFSDFTHETLYSANSIKQIANSIGYSKSKFYATGPVPKGFVSLVRYLIWKATTLIYKLIYFSETGRLDLISTQNIISILEK